MRHIITKAVATHKLISTLEHWSALFSLYTWSTLLRKPDSSSWSLGQLAMHLIEETHWYFEMAETCIANPENASEKMIPKAANMFMNDSFPDEIVKGDPFIAEHIPQPQSWNEVIEGFSSLKVRILKLEQKIKSSPAPGKSKHPGLGYFSPSEWIQYADMHLRHHLKQKERIDALPEIHISYSNNGCSKPKLNTLLSQE